MTNLFGHPDRPPGKRPPRNQPPPDPMMASILNGEYMDRIKPHTNRTATSDQAAAEVRPIFPSRLRHMLEIFAAADRRGLTDEEGQTLAHLGGDSWRPARGRLLEHGVVEKTTTTRRTEKGRQAQVYRITTKGREAAGR